MHRLVGAAFAALLLAGTSACTKVSTGTSTGGEHSWTQPGVVRIALYATPNTLNPLLSSNSAENLLAALAFDELVSVDSKGNDVPQLAAEVPTLANGGISKDGLTLTYHLRKNVKWHDGAPFTSDDVKYSFEQVMNPNNNVVSKRGYDLVTSVSTPDKYTVVFRLKQPFAPAIETLFSESDQPYRIIPKHLLASYPNLNRVPFNGEPVGTGPFKFVKWVRGDRIEYAANPDYFLGKPKLDRIVVKIITDSNTQDTQMLNHEVDFVAEIGGPQYRDLSGKPDVVLNLANSPQYEGIGINMARAPLNDPIVRQALAYALDKKTITADTQYGTSVVATENIPGHSWAYNPNVDRFDYNPAKAGQLLDGDGWKMGPGGICVKNGQQLSLQFVYGQGSTAAQNVGALVQSELKAVGIDAPIKTYTFVLLYGPVQTGGIYNSGKFDINLYAWVAGADPDDSSQFTCPYVPPTGNNVFHFCNKEFDAAENDALTHYDRPTRKAAYARTQAIMAKEIPLVFLFWPKQRAALSPDLRGYDSNGVTETWNAWQWSI
ncbi:MAG: peptide ABC transporter substrate-binding protein [Candidatus Eremiobacteraeota bacterium]|nr:peptide ABC transporter substrate-binding protein [Candidatus Eremiobacteraeota bacterium]